MSRFQRWAALLGGYFLLWPTVVALMDFNALADGGAWVLMIVIWGTMGVAMLPLLAIKTNGLNGKARSLRLAIPYICIFFGCLPWIWLWSGYPYPWLILLAHVGYAILVQVVVFRPVANRSA